MPGVLQLLEMLIDSFCRRGSELAKIFKNVSAVKKRIRFRYFSPIHTHAMFSFRAAPKQTPITNQTTKHKSRISGNDKGITSTPQEHIQTNQAIHECHVEVAAVVVVRYLCHEDLEFWLEQASDLSWQILFGCSCLHGNRQLMKYPNNNYNNNNNNRTQRHDAIEDYSMRWISTNIPRSLSLVEYKSLNESIIMKYFD